MNDDSRLWDAYADGRRDEAEEYAMLRRGQARALILWAATAWSPILAGLGIWWLFS